MNYKEEIIRYWLERAEETYQEALVMQRGSTLDSCANRGCITPVFMLSVLCCNSMIFHQESTAVFLNQHFIKTGIFDKEFGRLYRRLFDARQEGGDCIDFVRYAAEDVEPWIEKVRLFIDIVSEVIEIK